jgi:Abi-like protein
MTFQDFQNHISPTRLHRYLTATNLSKSRAMKLYKANLKVSQAFHPLLGLFEVVLRNNINHILENHFADPDWIINQKNGFMNDPSLTYRQKRTGRKITNDFLKNEVLKIEKKLRAKGIAITSGKIIAEQNFGFWTDLFAVHHYRLLKGKPIQIFTALPPSTNRNHIFDQLTKIRKFRNRINHNEPICFLGSAIDFTETMEVYHHIIQLLTWLDPQLIGEIRQLDKVQRTIKQAQKI